MRQVIVKENDVSKEQRMVVVSDRKLSGNLVERDGFAIFHQFGADYKEFETSGGAITLVAIVEWPSGEVETVSVDRIRFVTL